MFTIDVPEILGYMARRGLNRKSFSKKVGITENTLRSYLKNPEKIPYEALVKFAEILDIPVEEARRIFFKS